MTSAQQAAAWLEGSSPAGSEAVAQVQLRQNLAQHWQISRGERILELGCGQGDCTAVLADLVGSTGRVTAIDPAPETYGSPLTLGQSQAKLLASPVGSRIEFRNDFSLSARSGEFADLAFDAVVMANCSWYFAGKEQIYETFVALKRLAGRLCFSEWDLNSGGAQQEAHRKAVLVQSEVHRLGGLPEGNIRTPLTRAELLELIAAAGWQTDNVQSVSPGMASDYLWEISLAQSLKDEVAQLPGITDEQRNDLFAKIEQLRTWSDEKQSLDCFSLTARSAKGLQS